MTEVAAGDRCYFTGYGPDGGHTTCSRAGRLKRGGSAVVVY